MFLAAGALLLTFESLREYLFLVLPVVALIVLAIRWFMPLRVCFDADARVLRIDYFLGKQLGRTKCHPFSSLIAVHSYLRTDGESIPVVILEVIIVGGISRIIDTADAILSDKTSLIAWCGWLEPSEITDLRQRIAQLTGAPDRGYLGGGV